MQTHLISIHSLQRFTDHTFTSITLQLPLLHFLEFRALTWGLTLVFIGGAGKSRHVPIAYLVA